MFPYTQVYFSPLVYWPRKCKCLLLPISVLLPGEEGGGRGGAGEERSKQFAADLLSYGLQFTEDKWTIGLEGGRTSVVLIVLMRDQNFSHPAIALYFLWLIWTYCW